MSKFTILHLIILLLILIGCVPNNVFYKKSRQAGIVQKNYLKLDTLRIVNYSFYNAKDYQSLTTEIHPFDINKDSIFDVFLSSVNQLELENVKIEAGRNYIDSLFYNTNRPFKTRNINTNQVLEMAGNKTSKFILVPFIHAYNNIAFTCYITSGGMAGNNGFYFITWLDLIVFIVKGEEIIYSRQIRYKSDQVWADTKSEIEAIPPLAAVKQEHWDELVRLAMEDYIKRLK